MLRSTSVHVFAMSLVEQLHNMNKILPNKESIFLSRCDSIYSYLVFVKFNIIIYNVVFIQTCVRTRSIIKLVGNVDEKVPSIILMS